MTILYALLALLVANLFITITFLYELIRLVIRMDVIPLFYHGIQHHARPDDPDSLISLLLILLCDLV